MKKKYDIIIVGGGAAGFFAAIEAAKKAPDAQIVILERGKEVLQKVKISGGGRCNLTHACFDPAELIQFYPRGSKELLGPFHRFAPGDTLEWFESRGVATKIEADGRIFPQSDQSQTVISCLTHEARKWGIQVLLQQNVRLIVPPSQSSPNWMISTAQKTSFQAPLLMLASGSNPTVWELVKALGHKLTDPVPSLFTFNIKHPILKGLPGLSLPMTHLHIPQTKLQAQGPTLITHWGLSGPGILRLSAWGARILHQKGYQFPIEINWLGEPSTDRVKEKLLQQKQQNSRKQLSSPNSLPIPHRLWESLIRYSKILGNKRWADISSKELEKLMALLTKTQFLVHGKSTFKEEFVTAGGISLKEIHFKRFESKIHPGLYFAGEVLDIDAITGGFNFQAAWTGGWIAGGAMAEAIKLKMEK